MDSRAPRRGRGRGPGRSPVWVQSGQGAGRGLPRCGMLQPGLILGMRATTERSGPRAARRRAQRAAHWGGGRASPAPLPPGLLGAGPQPRGSVLDGQGGAPGLGATAGPGPLRRGSSCVGSWRPRCHSSGRGPTQGGRRAWLERTTHLPACHRCTAARLPRNQPRNRVVSRRGPTHQGRASENGQRRRRSPGTSGRGGRSRGRTRPVPLTQLQA